MLPLVILELSVPVLAADTVEDAAEVKACRKRRTPHWRKQRCWSFRVRNTEKNSPDCGRCRRRSQYCSRSRRSCLLEVCRCSSRCWGCWLQNVSSATQFASTPIQAGDQGIPWITVPASRLLLAPCRNLKVTVPGVVGVHVKVVGFPAVREKPSGTLKGLGFAARATAASPPRIESIRRRILRGDWTARLSLFPGRKLE